MNYIESRKGTKYKCNNCGVIVVDDGIGFEPFIHNIDTGHTNLEKCGDFILFAKKEI